MALLPSKANAAPATSLLGAFVVFTIELLHQFGLEIKIEQVHAINNWIAITVLLASAVIAWKKGGAELPPPGPDAPPLFPPNVPGGGDGGVPGGGFRHRN